MRRTTKNILSHINFDINNKDLLFFDFEVFQNNWMVVARSEKREQCYVVVDDREKLKNLYLAFKDTAIWVGHNITHYDQYILKGILCGMDPAVISRKIIVEGMAGWQLNESFKELKFVGYDTFGTVDASLKRIEGALGTSIRESTVSFDINRPLTQDEIKETIKYCTADVNATRNLFMETLTDFESIVSLIHAFKLDFDSSIIKTKQQLAGIILNGKYNPDLDHTHPVKAPSTLRLSKPEYVAVVDWYAHKHFQSDKDNSGFQVMVGGTMQNFGQGGTHSACADIEAQKAFKATHKKATQAEYGACRYHLRRLGLIFDLDVTSFYPSLMIRYNLLPRTLENPALFKQMYDKRVEFKRNKDPLAVPYKVLINSVYGAMGMKGSRLYDPQHRLEVCVFGQLLLTDLVEKLEVIEGFKIIQNNTDGTMFTIANEEDVHLVDEIAGEWEERTGMSLSYERWDEIWQKDVNNYYLIGRDKDGKLLERAKGTIMAASYPKTYDKVVIGKALREYFLHNTAPADYMPTNDNLKDYQMVVKLRKPNNLWARKTGSGCVVVQGAVQRFFASKRKEDGTYVMGQTANVIRDSIFSTTDNMLYLTKYTSVGGIPPNVFTIRDAVCDTGRHTVDDRLDMNWYIELANKLIEQFGGDLSTCDGKRRSRCKITDFM